MRKKINSVVELLRSNRGRTGKGFGETISQHALEAIMADIGQRPGLDSARKLVLEFSFEPQLDTLPNREGLPMLESVKWGLKVVSKIPGQSVDGLSAQVIDGVLVFNEESPTEIQQRTLDEEETRNQKDGG